MCVNCFVIYDLLYQPGGYCRKQGSGSGCDRIRTMKALVGGERGGGGKQGWGGDGPVEVR